MSARGVRTLAVLALLAAGIGCGFLAVMRAEAGVGMDGIYRLRYEQTQTASRVLLDTLEEEGMHYTLVRESFQTVEAPLFLRERHVIHVELAGDPALLFLPDRLLGGSFPTDARGCVVDLSTARELWGSDAPFGLELECGGRVYDVVGVVQASRPLVLTAAEPPFAFTSALLRPDKDNPFPLQALGEFEQTLSQQKPLRSDTARLPAWMRLLARLPFWALLVHIAVRCLRRIPLGRGASFFSVLLSGLLAGWVLRLPNPVTADMLPTRWSEFSFWRHQAETAVDNFCTAWMLPGTLSELLLLREVILPTLGWTAASFACLLLARAEKPGPRSCVPESAYLYWKEIELKEIEEKK